MYPYASMIFLFERNKKAIKRSHAELVSASNSQTLKQACAEQCRSIQGDVKRRLPLLVLPIQIELNAAFDAHPHLLQ